MTIEVTDADVVNVLNATGRFCECDPSYKECDCWESADPKEIIAAAWQVMEKKQADTLASVSAMLPCSFCGANAIRRNHYNSLLDCRSYVVECGNCECYAQPRVSSQGPDSYGRRVLDQVSNELAAAEADRRWNVRFGRQAVTPGETNESEVRE